MKKFAVLILTLSAWAQVADDANKGYKTKEGRDKVAAGLDDPHRDGRQKPLELVAAMNIKPGMTVADIGTGTGYMLKFLSDAVGPAAAHARPRLPDAARRPRRGLPRRRGREAAQEVAVPAVQA